MILLQFLGIAAYYDWRHRIVPNVVILTGFCVGLVLNCMPGPEGAFAVLRFIISFFVTMLCLLPVFYSFGAGAGDLKLTALLMAYLGVERGMAVLLPGLLLALIALLLGQKKLPLALSVFLGALPSLLF